MTKRARQLLAAAVGVFVVSLGIWWLNRSPDGAKEVCERFVTLAVTNHCREAYQLSVASTYSFSSVDAFCQEHGDDYDRVSVGCRAGKWNGEEYVVDGVLKRSRGADHYPDIAFGMALRRMDGRWYVARWSFDD